MRDKSASAIAVKRKRMMLKTLFLMMGFFVRSPYVRRRTSQTSGRPRPAGVVVCLTLMVCIGDPIPHHFSAEFHRIKGREMNTVRMNGIPAVPGLLCPAGRALSPNPCRACWFFANPKTPESPVIDHEPRTPRCSHQADS